MNYNKCICITWVWLQFPTKLKLLFLCIYPIQTYPRSCSVVTLGRKPISHFRPAVIHPSSRIKIGASIVSLIWSLNSINKWSLCVLVEHFIVNAVIIYLNKLCLCFPLWSEEKNGIKSMLPFVWRRCEFNSRAAILD